MVSIAILLLFMFGSDVYPSRFTWEEIGVILLMPLGLITGLILGWQEEAKGGALAVFSVAAFYLAYGLALKGSFIEGWWILFFLLPGSLLLLYAALLSSSRSRMAAK